MTPYLQSVAEDLYSKYEKELSRITVVFPNHRARLFFNEYLTRISPTPIWSPAYTTIQDLFRQQSSLDVPDTLKLISDLYTIYNEEVPRKETFDEFYFWGEMLLNDFDDVDKNMVDAKMLFRNIQEQAQYIDTFDHLADEQKEALRTFFKNFSPDMRTELKDRFIQLWDSLIHVYDGFRKKLAGQGLAYEGMLHRMVIEHLQQEGCAGFKSEKYAFVGFNVLTESEKKLFTILQRAGKTHFYWDYDNFYVDRPYHEAGTYIRENLSRFPNEFSKAHFNHFNTGEKRKITFVSSSTNNAQAKYLDKFLKNSRQEGIYQDADTAVVLCDESLLLPVLHSIPDCVEDINVTMGFPLVQTPAYSLMKNLLEMQMPPSVHGKKARFRYNHIAPVLRHPYIRTVIPESDKLMDYLNENNRFYPSLDELHLTEKLATLFTPAATPVELTAWLLQLLRIVSSHHKQENAGGTPPDNEKELIYDDLYKEAIFRAYTQINKIHQLLQSEEIKLSTATLVRLLKNILSTVSIPFSGEPVKGMQIMGMLETRNLDFSNVVLLSVNEGILPGTGKESTFIPYNLRKGYGLTTIEHKNSLYAYYFYRLLQRAENITLVYNTATDGLNKGQMSRFMLQLLAETDFDIHTEDIRSHIHVVEPQAIEIKKTEETVDLLISRYDTAQNKEAYLSPSALNCLIDCSLRFYFKYVLRLTVKDELTEEVDASMFGTIFHKSAEILYHGKIKKVLTEEELNALRSDRKMLENIVDSVFKTEYFKLDVNAALPEYTGEQLINRKVITDFLQKLLLIDAQYAPFTILQPEQLVYEPVEVKTPRGKVMIKIGGIVDRMDMKDGTVRIVDYKTGGTPARPTGIKSLFEQAKDRANYVFQAFLYAAILNRQLDGQYNVKPALFYIHRAAKDYSPDIRFTVDKKTETVDSISTYEEEFREYLLRLVHDLFDKEVPFAQTPVTERCAYCDYRDICRRRV